MKRRTITLAVEVEVDDDAMFPTRQEIAEQLDVLTHNTRNVVSVHVPKPAVIGMKKERSEFHAKVREKIVEARAMDAHLDGRRNEG